ncbi:MAG: hypothetical protein COZ34_04055 [Candidatus Pacebacteria bacterium CG_4_10_14_3_um_filter_34_15]|nr:MAG: hypothetical protein AUJ41_00850 [Candidatus Pacebacteria bacterium CG1_02_43_31]PIX81284.1 MAG: hypothetical protein COZ34_04055 [Candidatus Pacebacteria bacterium CG_4_10_14_3_um_filter_34_15]
MKIFKTKFLSLLLLFIFFGLLFFGVKNQSQSWYFQDETEHITLGWMITDYGRQLYTNLSTNHQPLPIFVGSLSKFISYNTLFIFIDGLRISMWFFALITSIIIVFRFKWIGLISVTLTYSLSHYYFGWHVLAESLVVPSVIWMLLTIFDKKELLIDKIIFGVSSFWITFSLLPLWPFVLLSNIYYFWSKKMTRKLVLIGFLVPTFVLFLFINPFHWWQETIINNVLFFLPYEATNGIEHYFRILFYPLLYFTFFKSQIARFYIAFVILIITIFIIFKQKIIENKEKRVKILISTLLIISLNPRESVPSVVSYNIFHLFPYIAGISVLISLILNDTFLLFKFSKNMKIIFIVECIFLGLLFFNNLPWIWEKRDKLSDYYIKYDTFQSYGTALKTISSPGDTLLTGPNGSGYMNMMGDLPLAGRQNFHLEWAYRTPYLREAWMGMIENNPPTFIYFDFNNDSYSKILKPLVDSNYIALKRINGSSTQLMMRKDAINKVTIKQWKAFEDQSFLIPDTYTIDLK